MDCHGEVPSNGDTIWKGEIAKAVGIDLFDSQQNGYKKRGSDGGGQANNLTAAEFIAQWMPKEADAVGTERGEAITAYLTDKVGRPWCPGDAWPPEEGGSNNNNNNGNGNNNGNTALKPAGTPIKALVITVNGKTNGKTNHWDGKSKGQADLKAIGMDYNITTKSIIHQGTQNGEIKNDVLADENLADYDVLILIGTMANAFKASGEAKIKEYMENGGNFLGFYQAATTENGWAFYWDEMMHAKYQNGHTHGKVRATVTVAGEHPVTKGMPQQSTIGGRLGWYKPIPKLDEVTVLLNGTGPKDGWEFKNDPLAWTADTPWGGRATYSGISSPQADNSNEVNLPRFDETEWFKRYVARLMLWTARVELD